MGTYNVGTGEGVTTEQFIRSIKNVFDEVDSGIGGAVSTAVGIRLRQLGNNRQVLVVTHSPQVAVLGKDHYLVKKETRSDICELLRVKLLFLEKFSTSSLLPVIIAERQVMFCSL